MIEATHNTKAATTTATAIAATTAAPTPSVTARLPGGRDARRGDTKSPSGVMSMVRGICSVMKNTWREIGCKQEPCLREVAYVSAWSPLLPLKTVFRAILLLLPAAASAQATPQGTSIVPMGEQDMVEENIARSLPLPETAEWHFAFKAPYAGGGDVVCGSVNYQSLERKYVGSHRFYAIIYNNKITLAQLQDPPSVDVSGEEAVKFHRLCDRK
jgi:hypothetical protein